MIDIESLRGTLIVSCQAPDGSPLRSPDLIAAIAEAVVLAGASAVRVNSAEHVAAVRARVGVPIIGIEKVKDAGGALWITPTLDDARRLVEAGADIIALDATIREHEGGPSAEELIPLVRGLGVPVMADIDDVISGRRAADLGAELIGTTLSGYTSKPQDKIGGPNIRLVQGLAELPARVVAEGRISSPTDVSAAFGAGAFAVVVGTSITEPMALTRRFLAATPALTNGEQS